MAIPKTIFAALCRCVRRKHVKLPTMAYLPAIKSAESRGEVRAKIVTLFLETRSIRHVARTSGYNRSAVRQILREEGAYQPPTTGIKKPRPTTAQQQGRDEGEGQ
jgi:hypothetical protein